MAHPRVEEVRELLRERKSEVDRHLEFAKALIDSKANAIALVPSTEAHEDNTDSKIFDYRIDRSLIKTISATGYLLIYNLLESTMTSALHAIHTQLADEQLTYDQLSEKLRKICLKNFKDSINIENMLRLHDTAINSVLVSIGYEQKKLWNGNVDATKIKAKTKDYGINFSYRNDDIDDVKRNLLSIKEKRNALAHGELSFEQCGQETPIDALLNYSQQAFIYLEAVLEGIDVYLDEKKYSAAV